MIQFLSLALTLFSCITGVFADFDVGDVSNSFNAAKDSITISWSDNGQYPNIDTFKSISFLLCTGSNAEVECPISLAGPLQLSNLGGKYTISLSSVVSQGGNGPYFIQVNGFMTTDGTGGQSISYTNRFSLTGMTGTALKPFDGGDTSPPQAQDINMPQDQISTLADVPYTAQTGRFRYAPMQLQPGTTVTKKLVASPRYPTSHVTYYKSNMPSPFCYSTITPGWSYTFSSMTNYATTNAPPTYYYQATAVIASRISAQAQERRRRWAV